MVCARINERPFWDASARWVNTNQHCSLFWCTMFLTGTKHASRKCGPGTARSLRPHFRAARTFTNTLGGHEQPAGRRRNPRRSHRKDDSQIARHRHDSKLSARFACTFFAAPLIKSAPRCVMPAIGLTFGDLSRRPCS